MTDFPEFARLVGAILVANWLTVLCVFGLMRIERYEREHGAFKTRIGDLVMVIVPSLVMIWGLYYWGAFQATPLRHLTQPAQQSQQQAK